MHWWLARWSVWSACDVGEGMYGLENDPEPHSPTLYIASHTSKLILQPFCRFTYVAAHSIALPLLLLRHNSLSNPSAALPTSKLILKPFRCFTYAIGTSPTSQLILNPSVASPTPQALHVLHLASHQCIGGWKNSLWWTSLLQQVTKFRSSYSFG